MISEVCRHLDGIPLAIELAAARARSLGVAAVAQRLGGRLRLLSGRRRNVADRQQTLQATLDWSYVLLSDHEQAMFDRLGVFVGWFTSDDAIAVAGDDEIDEYDTLAAVSGLVDNRCASSTARTRVARYRYLETMRVYARDHLVSDRTLATWQTRHALHHARVAHGSTRS